jgi:hypothetical protein
MEAHHESKEAMCKWSDQEGRKKTTIIFAYVMNEVIPPWFFKWPNSSSRTQPLTEISTRNLPGGKGRPSSEVDNLTANYETTAYKMSEPRRLTTLWASAACYKDSFAFLYGSNPRISMSYVEAQT